MLDFLSDHKVEVQTLYTYVRDDGNYEVFGDGVYQGTVPGSRDLYRLLGGAKSVEIWCSRWDVPKELA